MRIELPTASWAETVQRADDDAHTMTVASTTAPGWAEALFAMDPAQALRTQVAQAEPVVLTLTF